MLYLAIFNSEVWVPLTLCVLGVFLLLETQPYLRIKTEKIGNKKTRVRVIPIGAAAHFANADLIFMYPEVALLGDKDIEQSACEMTDNDFERLLDADVAALKRRKAEKNDEHEPKGEHFLL